MHMVLQHVHFWIICTVIHNKSIYEKYWKLGIRTSFVFCNQIE